MKTISKNKQGLCGFLSGLLLLAAGTVPTQASVIDVTFSPSLWSTSLNGTAPSSVAGLYGFGFTFGGVDIGLDGGFFHNQSYNSDLGLPVYDVGPTIYGAGLPPGVSTGNATFFSGSTGGLTLNHDQTGYLGFKTAGGNFGYVEFDWVFSSRTLSILSAKIETTPGVAITTIPEPTSALLLLGSGAMLLNRRRRAAIA